MKKFRNINSLVIKRQLFYRKTEILLHVEVGDLDHSAVTIDLSFSQAS